MTLFFACATLKRFRFVGGDLCNQLVAGESLIFFYTKSGHPLGDHINRLVVGVGSLEGLGPLLYYDHVGEATYPLWDRIVRHSIRPTGSFCRRVIWWRRAYARISCRHSATLSFSSAQSSSIAPYGSNIAIIADASP